jgi:hypothetical protein
LGGGGVSTVVHAASEAAAKAMTSLVLVRMVILTVMKEGNSTAIARQYRFAISHFEKITGRTRRRS